jgi:ABC-type protease/lipase transport system fused ATPase/permease subunit
MPATERYQADVFGIVVLITAAITIIFLIISSVYFLNLTNYKMPSRGQSTFLFWLSIILIILIICIGVFAIIRILRHKSIIYKNTPTQDDIHIIEY